MNTVKVFAEGVAKQIHDYLPAEYGNVRCEIQENLKNNGVRMVGVEFNKPDSTISPVIYMEAFYDDIKKGKAIESVMQDIAECYVQNVQKTINVNEYSLMSFESILQWIEPILLNTAENREMLAQMPHRKMADLSLFYSVVFPDQGDDMQASMKIKNAHMEQWGLSEQNLYDLAMKNMEQKPDHKLTSMTDSLRSALFGEIEQWNLLRESQPLMVRPPGEMYVLTNGENMYGASLLAVPGIMEKVDQLFPEGYYILPSSIHETIILPKPCGVPAKELGEMVREINRTEVNREERLSDCVYEYDKEKSVIRQVPESVRRREMER